MDQLTLAALFTAAGAIAAALMIRQLVEVLKAVFPVLSDKVSGALQAFVASAVLYGLAFVAVGPFTPEGVFAGFLSWLGCAVGAVGINATLGHVTGSDQRKAIEAAAMAYHEGEKAAAKTNQDAVVLATFQAERAMGETR